MLKWNLDGGTEISQVSFKYHRFEDKQKSYGLSVLGELALWGGGGGGGGGCSSNFDIFMLRNR